MAASSFFFVLFIMALTLWLSSIIVFNGRDKKYVTIIEKQYKTDYFDFRYSPLSFKLPFPLEVIHLKILLKDNELKKYIKVGYNEFEFTLNYDIINPVVASHYIPTLEEYLFEFLANVIENIDEQSLLIEDINNKIIVKLDKALTVKGILLKSFVIIQLNY